MRRYKCYIKDFKLLRTKVFKDLTVHEVEVAYTCGDIESKTIQWVSDTELHKSKERGYFLWR